MATKKESKLEIIHLPVSSLVKLKGNPRIDVDPKAIERLAKLIKAHSFQNPLQVYKDKGKYEILAGNHRFDAGLTLGMTEFPCIVYEGNRKQALARAISDNQSSTWTDFDLPVLRDLLIDLDSGDIDMSITGFNSHELELMMTAEFQGEAADAEPQIDRAEELNKTWKVKTGDLWQIGDHRLLCGNSTLAADVQKVMGGEKADMVHADPPYQMNLNTDFDSMFTADKRHRKTGKRFDAVIGDDGTFDISACMAACVDIGEQFWWGADYYRKKLPDGGGWYVWDKRWNDSGMDLDKVVGNCFELCWSKVAHKRLLFRVTWSGHHGLQGEDTKSRVHPNQKPTELIADLLRLIEGDMVYDPCLGSGTTMVACQNLNRKCRGIEISESYCSVILQRMKDAFPNIEIRRID